MPSGLREASREILAPSLSTFARLAPTGRVRVVKARRKAVSKKQVAGTGMVRKLIAAVAV